MAAATTTSRDIAIVGSGVSGLAAFWALQRTGHNVHLFERDERIGGHTHSVPWRSRVERGKKEKKEEREDDGDDGKERSSLDDDDSEDDDDESVMVDLAFALFNTEAYPNFTAFLEHLNIPTTPMRPTFSLTRDAGAFEWSTVSLATLFAQPANLLSPRMWRLLFDIVRFNTFAPDILLPSSTAPSDEPIAAYLARNAYSPAFRDDYLLPLTASIWVTDPAVLGERMPARMLVAYLHNHGVLDTFTRARPWRVITGGASRYVDAVLATAGPRAYVHRGVGIKKVRKSHGKVRLLLDSGEERTFDAVILATHAPQALEMLGDDADAEERALLAQFRTSESTVVLHEDTSFLPRSPRAWAAWNYLARSASPTVSLTSRLTPSPPSSPAPAPAPLTTLNPPHPPSPALTHAEYTYAHPMYTAAAVRAQAALPRLQGRGGVWLAGAWMGYGFHEDGFVSGVRAAVGVGRRLGAGEELGLGGVLPMLEEGGKSGDEEREVAREVKEVRRQQWREGVLRAAILGVQALLVMGEALRRCWAGGMGWWEIWSWKTGRRVKLV